MHGGMAVLAEDGMVNPWTILRPLPNTATLYTRTGSGLQAVEVPQSLADEVAALKAEVSRLRRALALTGNYTAAA